MSTGPESAEQTETIGFLSEAESYGETGTVERVDTHAAVVFLVGERAYKLKRAITFPYLDYSTIQLRRIACEAELALNRRTAPDLYLEVRAVNRLPDGRLGFAPGEPVDWLVVMRRFDQHCLFDRLAAEGELTLQRLQLLTDRIVSFHGESQRMPAHGGATAMRAVIDANRESMARVAKIIPPVDADALHRASLSALAEVEGLLDVRRRKGRVRRCHGDLHLRNICLLQGVPTLFDCIEFSEELACIDVLYDLAFLLMDLWHRGLRAEANFVFNRYLDLADESDGLAAIPLFLSARAAVRAHVEAAAVEAQTSSEARELKVEMAHSYLTLAAQLLAPKQPCLVALGGLSGTGKSTLARGLAPILGRTPGARVLRSDVIRKLLMRVAPETPLPDSAYTKEAGTAVYNRLSALAAAALDAGFSVVADAVFASPDERNAIRDVAQLAAAPFNGLWLEAPIAALECRLAARTGDASDATVAVVRRQIGYDTGPIDWQAIDTAAGAAATVERARALLSNPSDRPGLSTDSG